MTVALGMSDLPIADYALLSDCSSAALVSRGGSVDWLCFPRFDSPSIFGRLLDDAAGHWSIRPTGDAEIARRYVDGTMLLETTYTSPTGTATVVDGLAVGRNERGHDRAIDTFERAVSHANDVGLLSEEVDSRTGELLGNFPQAFSHIGLVNAAWAIHEASSGPNVRGDV
jgi:GH15 family glucan-1,4-alpha-glucosidase